MIAATSPQGVEFIKHQEAFVPHAYPDGFGVWTCGWGHTKGVKHGDVCTVAEGEVWLADDLAPIDKYISVELPELLQQEHDALASLLFNVGIKPAWIQSTTMRLLKNGALYAASGRFKLWDKAERNGALVEVPGLLSRRYREQTLFRTGVYGYGIPNASYVR